MMRTNTFVVLLTALAAAVTLAAETTPESLSPEQTASAPAVERYVASAPSGYQLVESAGYRVFCLPADVEWVKAALDTMEPTTRPATMPSDLLAQLDAAGPEIESILNEQLAIAEPAATQELLAELRLVVEQFSQFEAPLIFLLASPDELADLMKNGWTNPLFRYNRLSHKASYDMAMQLRLDPPMDDTVVPAAYEPDADADAKKAVLIGAVRYTHGFVDAEISGRAQLTVQMALANFIEQQIDAHFKSTDDQVWLRFGVAGILSSQLTARINGMPAETLIDALMLEPRNAPVRAAWLDLLKPVALSDLRPEYVQPHLDAVRRRSMRAVQQWLADHPDRLPIALRAIAAEQPADGPALIQVIQTATSFDFTPLLRSSTQQGAE